MPHFDDLVPCTEGGWMILPPRHCPNGHRLGPGAVLVGHQPCAAGSCHGGHTTWQCLTCQVITYAPATGAGCRLLDVLAGPNDVPVSSTLRYLVVGSGLEFDDRGAHELKGVPGEWRLFAVASP
jgi:hypothetical protein